ncbi:AMP-binding protein, partial [Rugamonas sp. FT82W]|nr:AMP-binding protein [Duganella vulcania]
MKAPSTLAALLEAQAERRADAPAYSFLDRAANAGGGYSFGALCRRADAIASALQARGVGAGERVLIACNNPADFVPAFFAALRSGAIAVPTPPPRSRQRRRFESIIDDCRPVAALMAADDARFLIGADSSPDCRRLIVLDPQLAHDEARLSTPALRPSDVAFLQYTSGSTGQPRGVKVTHGAALANLAMIQAAFRQDQDSGFVGWLPLFHDMGLIGNVLQPLYLGSTSVLMPPAAFLENPLRWLETISAARAHTSGGPDFAYRACVRALAHAPAGWAPDLGAWRVAFNGAEPVRAATLEAFVRAFAPFGFQASAFLPCYGMAEATLLAAGAGRDQAPRMFDVDAGQLEGGRA